MTAVFDKQEMKKREKANFRIVNLLKPGTKVRAIYADDDNDPSWYDAVINSVEVSEWLGGWVWFSWRRRVGWPRACVVDVLLKLISVMVVVLLVLLPLFSWYCRCCCCQR